MQTETRNQWNKANCFNELTTRRVIKGKRDNMATPFFPVKIRGHDKPAAEMFRHISSWAAGREGWWLECSDSCLFFLVLVYIFAFIYVFYSFHFLVLSVPLPVAVARLSRPSSVPSTSCYPAVQNQQLSGKGLASTTFTRLFEWYLKFIHPVQEPIVIVVNLWYSSWGILFVAVVSLLSFTRTLDGMSVGSGIGCYCPRVCFMICVSLNIWFPKSWETSKW